MRDDDINIGDVLQVRQWGDMVGEYGTNDRGNINTKYIFFNHMRHLCGRRFQVTNISDSGFGKLYIGFILDAVNLEEFQFTSDELEPLPDENWELATDEEIKLLFE